jgi:hypothetical protein
LIYSIVFVLGLRQAITNLYYLSAGNKRLLRLYILALLAFASTKLNANEIHFTDSKIKVDGEIEALWDKASWYPMPYLMADAKPTAEDFTGRYRLLWDNNYLYLHAQIIDDILFDKTPNPTVNYWQDDCLEVFIDSDASGGIHQYNHSAFAYHIGLDNQVVDLDEGKQARMYNQHVFSRWQRSTQQPEKINWEVAIKLFPDDYSDKQPLPAIQLKVNQIIGFMLAYCDNDGSPQREHFMGSVDIKPVNGDTNLGWIDADVFSRMTLIK